jgi:choline-glycine betaine transporter
LIWAFVISC